MPKTIECLFNTPKKRILFVQHYKKIQEIMLLITRIFSYYEELKTESLNYFIDIGGM
jgi:hypothetical protein